MFLINLQLISHEISRQNYEQKYLKFPAKIPLYRAKIQSSNFGLLAVKNWFCFLINLSSIFFCILAFSECGRWYWLPSEISRECWRSHSGDPWSAGKTRWARRFYQYQIHDSDLRILCAQEGLNQQNYFGTGPDCTEGPISLHSAGKTPERKKTLWLAGYLSRKKCEIKPNKPRNFMIRILSDILSYVIWPLTWRVSVPNLFW